VHSLGHPVAGLVEAKLTREIACCTSCMPLFLLVLSKLFCCLCTSLLIFLFVCRSGARPEVHCDASGGLIRSILITLDDLKITQKAKNGGRRITRVGQQGLDLVAGQVNRGEV
jgi:hypothetical protein